MTELERKAEQLAAQKRQETFKVSKLEWEPATKHNVNPIAQETPMTDKWHKEGLEAMKKKWGIDGQFACEGELGARLRERTLGDALASDAHARMRHSSIKTSNASYQGRAIKMAVEVTR
jgi:hypothetical protein